jgi:ubiquinone/menaquinone biosynthesis C-methylase UbiE
MERAAEAMYADTLTYELENKETVEDIGFWRRLVGQYAAKNVLELACGTGRITIPLTRDLVGSGRICGLDLSAEMIETARQKLASEPEAVRQLARFLVADMCDFLKQLDGEKFDLIYVPYNSMAHLRTIDDQLSAFRNAAACLAPGGHFVVDVFNPNLAQLAASRSPAPVSLDLDLDHPCAGVSRMLRYISRVYAPDIQQERITFIYERYMADGNTQKRAVSFDSHTYFPRELELLLRIAGLSISERWGSYAGEPFTDTSPLMIFGAVAG